MESYSGEYYDLETKTYYLRSRVYEPSTGRFLSEDSVRGKRSNLYNSTTINQSIRFKGGCFKIPGINQYWVDDPLSLNLYTYTYNNPLRYTDPSGNIVIPLVAIPIAEALEVLLPIAGAAAVAWWNAPGNEVKKQATEAINSAFSAVKSIIPSFSTSKEATSQSLVMSYADAKTAVKAKENDNSTIIYRLGNGNATNLTPRPKDITGLSYQLTMPARGEFTMTTIEILNYRPLKWAGLRMNAFPTESRV